MLDLWVWAVLRRAARRSPAGFLGRWRGIGVPLLPTWPYVAEAIYGHVRGCHAAGLAAGGFEEPAAARDSRRSANLETDGLVDRDRDQVEVGHREIGRAEFV